MTFNFSALKVNMGPPSGPRILLSAHSAVRLFTLCAYRAVGEGGDTDRLRPVGGHGPRLQTMSETYYGPARAAERLTYSSFCATTLQLGPCTVQGMLIVASDDFDL